MYSVKEIIQKLLKYGGLTCSVPGGLQPSKGFVVGGLWVPELRIPLEAVNRAERIESFLSDNGGFFDKGLFFGAWLDDRTIVLDVCQVFATFEGALEASIAAEKVIPVCSLLTQDDVDKLFLAIYPDGHEAVVTSEETKDAVLAYAGIYPVPSVSHYTLSCEKGEALEASAYSKLVVSRDGSCSRTANELCQVYAEEASLLLGEDEPTIPEAPAENTSADSWCDYSEALSETADDYQDKLSAEGFTTFWNDGFFIYQNLTEEEVTYVFAD